MAHWLPIIYCDYWDQPRRLIVSQGEQSYLFTCPFDDVTEKFLDHYLIYLMPPIDASEFQGTWPGIENRAIRFLGKVELSQSSFVLGPNKMINLDVLQNVFTE